MRAAELVRRPGPPVEDFGEPRTKLAAFFNILAALIDRSDRLWHSTAMSEDVIHKEIAHALEILELTLPVTSEDLERARRVQLYTWNPARFSNLTNNPKQYMQAYKKAEEMTKLVEASYALLSVMLVPTTHRANSSPLKPVLTAGCSKRHLTRPQETAKPEAYPLGYVKDSDEPRTT